MPQLPARRFTPAEDAYICAHYAGDTLGAIATALGRPCGSLQQRITALAAAGRLDPGTRHYHRPWTAAEEETLREDWGRLADATVARRLGRTPEGCKVRATRLGLSRKRHTLTARAVARICGVDSHAVARWIALGWLAGTRSPIRCGATHCWTVPGTALEAFLGTHPEAYNRTRIDPERDPYWRHLADAAARPAAAPPAPPRYAARWTPPEDRYLETHWGLDPDAAVAAHLGRTVAGCVSRAYDLALNRHDAIRGWLTADQAARRLGVPGSRVQRWIALGLLPATRSTVGAARPYWQISPQTLATVARQHPELVHPEACLHAADVARRLGVAPAVVAGWIASGLLPARKSLTSPRPGSGARWVICPADFAAFCAAHPGQLPARDQEAA